MLFSTYCRCVILTNYINQKVKPNINVFQNSYMQLYYICNNLKIELKPYGIENTKQNTKQKKTIILFYQNLLLTSFTCASPYLQNSSH
jgi:hypothetical protein